MATTRTTKHVKAPRAVVYSALVDPGAIESWRVPDGMSCVVHSFDPREGGAFRVSLRYDTPTESGKSGNGIDTYTGHFDCLVPDRVVVEVIEFETDDPELAGEMTMTTVLAEADGGTEVTIIHEGIPPGLSTEENELGTRMALDKLARLLEPGDA